MKAAQINGYGSAENIVVNDVDEPVVQPGMVLVEVHAASINPWDRFVREGGAKDFMPLELQVTLGGDIAGVVKAVGEGVVDFKAGDKVYGSAGAPGGSGGLAETAFAKAELLAPMPAIDFNEAAAIVLTGSSALQAISRHIKIQPGQRILIHGGAGGIGSTAIQIAKHVGAHVTTTATGNGIEFVKNLGADEVIDYKTQKFEEMLSNLDAVFDTVAGATYRNSFKVLKKGGILVSMNAQPDQELMEQYGVEALYQSTHTTTELLNELSGLIDSGVVKIHIEKTFPLSEVQQAFKAWEAGQVRGKIVISVR